jgi:hypothetical protein
MSAPNGVTQLCITLRDDPESIALVNDGVLRIRLADGVALYLDDATPEVLRALADAADTAADLKDQAAIVALNTPAPPVVPDNVHTMCVPDWGAAS